METAVEDATMNAAYRRDGFAPIMVTVFAGPQSTRPSAANEESTYINSPKDWDFLCIATMIPETAATTTTNRIIFFISFNLF